MSANTQTVQRFVLPGKQLFLMTLQLKSRLFKALLVKALLVIAGSIAILASVSCSGESGQTGRYSETDAAFVQKQYLIDNAARSGVITTPSGLQYEVLNGSTGPTPEATDTVTVHYVGTLIDGTEFDSSYSRNEPATFPLNGTIKGWVEGVQLMSVGSHYRFVIPAELAYGDRGAGSQVKPGDTLVFSIELLSIQ